LKKIFKRVLLSIASVSLLTIYGCGGGGSADVTPSQVQTMTFKGIVATGYPAGGAEIRVDGSDTLSISDNDGSFTIDVPAYLKPPYIFNAKSFKAGREISIGSISMGQGSGEKIVNITPFTDVIKRGFIDYYNRNGVNELPVNLSLLETMTEVVKGVMRDSGCGAICAAKDYNPINSMYGPAEPATNAIDRASEYIKSTYANGIAVFKDSVGNTLATIPLSKLASGENRTSDSEVITPTKLELAKKSRGLILPTVSVVNLDGDWCRMNGTLTRGEILNNVCVPAKPLCIQPLVAVNGECVQTPVQTEEITALNLLNVQRVTCGFKPLINNINLNKAALNHSQWIVANNIGGHIEDPILTRYFTGSNPFQRATFFGYDALDVDENIYQQGDVDYFEFAEKSLRNLLSAPYHLAGLMAPMRDIGIGIYNGTPIIPHGYSTAATYLLGSTKAQGYDTSFSDNEVLTYPCEGVAGVSFSLTGEDPNPIPGRDLSIYPIGHPVYLRAKEGHTLSIASAKMTKVTDNKIIALRPAITFSNDPNSRFSKNEAYVVPDGPLEYDSEYQVIVTGKNNAIDFTKSFKFSTESIFKKIPQFNIDSFSVANSSCEKIETSTNNTILLSGTFQSNGTASGVVNSGFSVTTSYSGPILDRSTTVFRDELSCGAWTKVEDNFGGSWCQRLPGQAESTVWHQSINNFSPSPYVYIYRNGIAPVGPIDPGLKISLTCANVKK
jgi:uncharacterized protein YkwD